MDNILGMDFLKKYKLDLRWGDEDDYFLYDKKSQTKAQCQFVKIPKGTLQSVSSVKVVPPTTYYSYSTLAQKSGVTDQKPGVDSLSQAEAAFQVFSVQVLEELQENKTHPIPLAYQKLIKEFSSILTPDFKNVKHSVVHSIPTRWRSVMPWLLRGA